MCLHVLICMLVKPHRVISQLKQTEGNNGLPRTSHGYGEVVLNRE